jgi:hypothetical protein
LKQNAAARSNGGMLERLLRAHAAHDFDCQCNVTPNKFHDISGI